MAESSRSSQPADNGGPHGGFWQWLAKCFLSAPVTRRNAWCSFCRKNYRDVGPLVEGPGHVYICGACIELCQSILEQERRRRAG